MKRNNRHWIALITAAGVVWAMWLGTPALGSETNAFWSLEKAYFSFDAGVNLLQDFDLNGATAEADPGWRMGFTAGYNFNRWLGVEGEIGYAYAPLSDVDARFDYVPLLANVIFRYENRSKFTPYVGVGAGGAGSIFIFERGSISGDDSNIMFAWQAKAGVRYQINEKLSVGIAYKYFGTAEQNYRIEDDGGDLKFRFRDIHTHFVGLVLQGRF
jgi:opacity protein-like surface antigen